MSHAKFGLHFVPQPYLDPGVFHPRFVFSAVSALRTNEIPED